MTEIVNPELFILNYASNLWGGLNMDLIKIISTVTPYFLLFSKRYYTCNSPWNENNLLRFSISVFLIYNFILKTSSNFRQTVKI